MSLSVAAAKMEVSNFLIDHLGLDAEEFIEQVDACHDMEALHAYIFMLIGKFTPHINAELKKLCSEIYKKC